MIFLYGCGGAVQQHWAPPERGRDGSSRAIFLLMFLTRGKIRGRSLIPLLLYSDAPSIQFRLIYTDNYALLSQQPSHLLNGAGDWLPIDFVLYNQVGRWGRGLGISLLPSVQFSSVAQSCLTLRDPVYCSLPGSSVHGILQARVLECSSDLRAIPSFPSQLEWKIGRAWANTRGSLNSPS